MVHTSDMLCCGCSEGGDLISKVPQGAKTVGICVSPPPPPSPLASEAQGVTQAGCVSTVLRCCGAVAVRVMDCTGEGAMSTIITGLEWVVDNLQLPAVVLMSIGGDATLLLDQACEALVNAGATVVVAAGNDDEGVAV